MPKTRRAQFNFRLRPGEERLLRDMGKKLNLSGAAIVRLALERLWADVRAGKVTPPGLSFRR